MSVELFVDGTHPAPVAYTVPGSQSIRPESMCALFDGSGAGGSFLACCSIYSQAGHLIGRAFAPDTFGSGDKAQVSFGPFFRGTAAASGAGIQFDVDNVGGWLEVETSTFVGLPFSLANGLTVFFDDATQWGLAVNVLKGTVFTSDPASSTHSVTVEQGTTGTADAQALKLAVDSSSGTGGASGLDIVASSASASAFGVNAGVSASTATAEGAVFQADQLSAAGGASARGIGVQGLASSAGAGDAIGVWGQARATGAGGAFALLATDHTGKKIFEVRDDGSVHILTGTTVIADL